MADQWEMCNIIWGSMEVISPMGIKIYTVEEFIKKYDPSFSEPQHEMINRFWSLFMSEGWEPLSISVSESLQSIETYSFRKKYQA